MPSEAARLALVSQKTEEERASVLFDYMELKRFGQESLDESGLSVVEFFSWALSNAVSSSSQLFQDLFVLWILNGKQGGYFVEIGAMDGLIMSNTLLLEREYGWNGILSEPNPIYHETLKAERQCSVSNQAVYKESGATLEFLCTTLPQLSRLEAVNPNDSHEQRGRRIVENVVNVETTTVTDLLAKHNAPRQIDYMSIDTEGAELVVLEGLDWDQYDVSVFSVEHNGTAVRTSVYDLMSARGLVRTFSPFSRFDDWYVREDLARARQK